MDGLARTVDLAVKKMQEKKKELKDFQKKNAILRRTLEDLDLKFKAEQLALQQKLKEKVDCIRKLLEPRFLKKKDGSDEDFITNKQLIMDRMNKIETGMGRMHLFVKTSPNASTPITLDVEQGGKTIRFHPRGMEPKEYDGNPFDFVYKGIDKVETPGKKNFEAYIANLEEDIKTNMNCACIAYGPSGTGKTTMIQHIVRHFYEQTRNINVFQVYVRQNVAQHITDDIPETFHYTQSEEVGEGVRHEKFDLCTVDPESDITKIIKNEVEMIDSVGNQMYGHARNVFRMIEAACGNSEEAKKYCDTDQRGLVFRDQGFKQLFNDQKYKDMEGFDEFIERKWLQPIRDTVVLCNSTRVTLHQLVRDRFDYEKAFYLKPHPDEDETGAFVRSGGFIPLQWLSYIDAHYMQPISFFSDLSQLRLLRQVYQDMYKRSDSSHYTLENVNMYANFVDKSNQELAEIYGDKRADMREKYKRYLKFGYLKTELLNILSENQDSSEPGVHSWDDRMSYEDFAWQEGLTLYFKRVAEFLDQLQGNKSYNTENQVFRLQNKVVPFDSKTTEEFMTGVKMFSFQRSTPQNKESSRCATVYQLVFLEGKLLTLIDLPGNEDQVLGCQSENDNTVLCTETLGIRELLTYVRTLMTVKRLNVTPANIGIDYLSETFREVFEPLMDPMCKVGFLCFSANYAASPNYVPNTLATLNYMTGLATSSYSCEDGVNEAYAAKLIEEYATQRKDDEAEMLKLFPPQATPRSPLRTSNVSDATDVSGFEIPELPLLPPPLGGTNQSGIEKGTRVRFEMKYTMKDPMGNKRLYDNERFLYIFTCDGILDVDASNAYRFTKVGDASFKRHKFTVDVHSKENYREFTQNTKDKYHYLTFNFMRKTYFEDEVVRDEYGVVNLPRIFGKTPSHHRIPIQRQQFMNIPPPLVDIDLFFDGRTSVVTITPKNKRIFESTHDDWMEKRLVQLK